MLPLLFLATLTFQDPPKIDPETTKFMVYDAAKGYTLKVRQDGKIELTTTEEDKESGKKVSKTVTAANGTEFRQKHADLVKRYDLGRYLGAERKALNQDEFDEWWNKLKKGIPDLGPMPGLDQPFDEEMQKLLEEMMRGGRQRFRFGPGPGPEQPGQEAPPRQAPLPGGREFGVKVEAVGETLREQLSLKESEGVLVAEVKPGSLAEKSGLKLHDLLLKLDGKPVTDRWQFRADVLSALGKPEFSVELLRAGKRETVKVRTSARKDE